MSNPSFNTNDMENEKVESPKNDIVTSEEVSNTDAVKHDEDRFGKTDKEDKFSKEDKYSVAIGNIYQWACKLKDDFKSEASDMTHEVSEKSATMILNKLLESIDAELEAFDKKLEDSKKLVANAAEERNKIANKKDKYQDIIAQLES